tara:strand:- start:153 stop:1532 length:1380 start_codon:yes stop_codon:yes gene_type:complete
MARKPFVDVKISFNNKTLKQHMAACKKVLRPSGKKKKSYRSQIQLFYSDFISKQKQFKPATNTRKWSNPAARPDVQMSLKVAGLALGEEAARTLRRNTGRGAEITAEIKSRTSGRGDRTTTITQKTLGGDTLQSFEQQFGLTAGTKEDGEATYEGQRIDQISSKKLQQFVRDAPELEKEMVAVINEKFENFFFINFVDTQKGTGKPQVYVLGDAANSLKLATNGRLSAKNLEIRARQRKNNKKDRVFIVLQFRLSMKSYQNFLKQATVVTDQFHAFLGDRVYNRFIKYSIDRFAVTDNQDFCDFLNDLISFADTFKPGSNTPFEVVTEITQLPNDFTSIGADIPVDVADASKKRRKSQRFISGAQLTQMVKRKLGKILPKGPRRGPPLSPVHLTERTGNFRRSVQVFPNYRKDLIRYTYDPRYGVHRETPRNPDRDITNSIREVVTALYTRNFNIVRGF